MVICADAGGGDGDGRRSVTVSAHHKHKITKIFKAKNRCVRFYYNEVNQLLLTATMYYIKRPSQTSISPKTKEIYELGTRVVWGERSHWSQSVISITLEGQALYFEFEI